MSRLTIATSAQADASGGATFDGFGAPGTGTAWVVTAAVPLAPGTASFQAWRTTEVWATWLGSAAGGPLLVTGSQRLVVKGTGLTKTTTYRCVLTGQSLPESTAQGVSVAPISSSTLTKTTFSGAVKITGPVTLAAGTAVDITSGTIDLGAGTSVAINAGQLTSTTLPLQAVAQQMLVTTFGSGATGTVTLSANATLTTSPNYKTLTLAAGILLTSPWVVYCSTLADMGTATSALINNGANATTTTAGKAGGLAGSFLGGGKGGDGAGASSSPGVSPPAASWEGGTGGIGSWAGTHFSGGKASPPITTPILFGTIHQYSFSGGGGGGGGCPTPGYGGAGGGGVVMLAARKITGAGNVTANGGNGLRKAATTWAGPGGGGIALVYSHTAKTWTGKANTASGTVITEPSAVGTGGSHVVRLKATGAIFP